MAAVADARISLATPLRQTAVYKRTLAQGSAKGTPPRRNTTQCVDNPLKQSLGGAAVSVVPALLFVSPGAWALDLPPLIPLDDGAPTEVVASEPQTAAADRVGNPDTPSAPSPAADAAATEEQPAERPSKEVLVQTFQTEILPKIQSQIAEINKKSEPSDMAKELKQQLEVVQHDIETLVEDATNGEDGKLAGEANTLHKELADVRDFVNLNKKTLKAEP